MRKIGYNQSILTLICDFPLKAEVHLYDLNNTKIRLIEVNIL